MSTSQKLTFGQFLSSKFLEWEQSEHCRKTVVEFVSYINDKSGKEVIKRSAMTHHMNGHRVPTEISIIEAYAKALGPEVYDVLGRQRPNPMIQYIVSNWEELPSNLQDKIMGIIEHETSKVSKEGAPARRARKPVA